MKMLRFYFIILLLITICSSLFARSIKAYMSYSVFWSPNDGSYIETYLGIVGKSTTFVKNQNNKFQSAIEITMIFKQGNVIKDFKKYNLHSPEIDDTTNIDINFIDQQRFTLPESGYKLELQITDKNNLASTFKAIDSLNILFPAGIVSISGIQLVDSYKQTSSPTILTKSGYDIIPYIVNFFPQMISKLTFYSEIYNTDKVLGTNEKYLLNYYIESYETQIAINNFINFKTETAKTVSILFAEFAINDLPSGNYNLVIEVKNKENKIIASNKIFFQRSNPKAKYDITDISSLDITNTFASNITSKDTLKDYIQSLYPISNTLERIFAENQLEYSNMQTMQQFLYNFWLNRNNKEPEKAWNNYQIEVRKVNYKFSTSIKRGYATDRGRVYLQYGPPNTISENPIEPSNYPYEIWHYYTLQNQRNKKFVFYSTDVVTNDYELIHSDAVGELQDYAWQARIQKRNTIIKIDTEKGIDHWGNNANDFFKNPR